MAQSKKKNVTCAVTTTTADGAAATTIVSMTMNCDSSNGVDDDGETKTTWGQEQRRDGVCFLVCLFCFGA